MLEVTADHTEPASHTPAPPPYWSNDRRNGHFSARTCDDHYTRETKCLATVSAVIFSRMECLHCRGDASRGDVRLCSYANSGIQAPAKQLVTFGLGSSLRQRPAVVFSLLHFFCLKCRNPLSSHENHGGEGGLVSERGKQVLLLSFLYCCVAPLSVWAESGQSNSGHDSPVIHVLLALAVILLAAKLGGDVMVRLRQPEVLGELIVGIVLGNIALLGIHSFTFLRQDMVLEILSELGVVLLLFEVGLHTTVPDMMKVGASAFLVAVLGVIAPFFLGWGVSLLFSPTSDRLVHIYIGATLTATSVGITARVLTDLKRIHTSEAKIILGAAVIDDVLGLMVLAAVSGVIVAAEMGTAVNVGAVAGVLGRSLGFLIFVVGVGRLLMPVYFRLIVRLRSQGLLLTSSLVLCFGLAYLAGVVGLAPIVGAFTAGLILEPLHYQDLVAKQDHTSLEDLLAPLVTLMVPIFFVTMGARVNVADFTRVELLGFAACLTMAAIIGKQVCGIGVREQGLDRVAVGLGMIPRGEVGLIFASIGASLTLHGQPLIDSATYGAVVIMVVLTTLATPPLITWRFRNITETSTTLQKT